MSVSYYANLVLGFAVPQEDFIVEQPVRGCAHPVLEGASFCPVCGESMWETESGRIEPVFEHDSGIEVHNQNTIDFESGDEDLPRVVGVVLDVGRGVVQIPSPAAQQYVESQLRRALAASGIEVNTPFGLHLVRYVSY